MRSSRGQHRYGNPTSFATDVSPASKTSARPPSVPFLAPPRSSSPAEAMTSIFCAFALFLFRFCDTTSSSLLFLRAEEESVILRMRERLFGPFFLVVVPLSQHGTLSILATVLYMCDEPSVAGLTIRGLSRNNPILQQEGILKFLSHSYGNTSYRNTELLERKYRKQNEAQLTPLCSDTRRTFGSHHAFTCRI